MVENNNCESTDKPSSLLRWVGGKNWFLKYLPEFIPENYFNYYEPFLGGASVFFRMNPPNQCYLSDTNSELINAYVQVRDNLDLVIEELRNYENTSECYYSVWKKKFPEPYKEAAKFIFLNKTSFNGIYRVTLDGIYNVPYGHRKNATFLDEDNLRNASSKLQGCKIFYSDFGRSLRNVKEGDLVFIDPPYTVAHQKNGFIKYNQKLFTLKDQTRLANWVLKLQERGAFYILTNACHAEILKIYKQVGKPIKLTRKSLIGGIGAKRVNVDEYVFTNCI